MTARDVTPENPWLGLQPFGESNRSYFFGRSRETEELLKAMRHQPLTVLFGRSGNGKTSLLNAGVVPAPRQLGYLPIVVRFEFRGVSSSDSQCLIRQAMYKAAEECNKHAPDYKVEAEKVARPVGVGAHNSTSGLCSPNAPKVVLVFDQFEELFTLGAGFPLAVQAFLKSLADLVENTPPDDLSTRIASDPTLFPQLEFDRNPCRTLIVIRADFLSELERYRRLMPSLSRNRFQLDLLSGPQALEAVYRPGAIRGVPIRSFRLRLQPRLSPGSPTCRPTLHWRRFKQFHHWSAFCAKD